MAQEISSVTPLYSRQGNLKHMNSLLDRPRTYKPPAAQTAIDALVSYHKQQREFLQKKDSDKDSKPRTVKRNKKRR